MKLRGVFTIQSFGNPNKTVSYRVTGTKLNGERVRVNFQTEAEALAQKPVSYTHLTLPTNREV